MTFVLGVLLVWLHAAIRPRFGPGPKTAITAGLLVWIFAYFFPTVGISAVGMVPARLAAIACTWGLVEVPLAAWVGARLYTE